MKKISVILGLLVISCYTFAAKYDWGEPDTLAHYQIGPGTYYTSIKFYKKVVNLHQLTVDLNEPLNTVELFPSHGYAPDLSRETVSDQCLRNSSEGHRVVGGINHDLFYYTNSALCAGINARNGEIVSNFHNWGRSILSISKDKKAEVFPPKFEANVVLPDSDKIIIENINESASGIQDGRTCVLFNPMSHLTLTKAGTYVELLPIDEWLINGTPTRCKIQTIGEIIIQPNLNNYILFLDGAAATTFKAKVFAGDTIQIEQKFVQTTFQNSGLTATPAQNIKQALHGWPLVIFNGELHPNEWNDFVTPGRENNSYPCTQAGITQDGKKMFMITADKGTLVEDAWYLVDQGAYNVANFDGGGSALMVVDSVLVNNPMDGTERAVMNSVQAISLAPKDDSIAAICFKRPSLHTVPTALCQLVVLAHNQYGEVKNYDVKNVEFSCPSTLGKVDKDGVLHVANKAVDGIVTAVYNNLTAQMRFVIGTLDSVSVTPTNILIDNRRECPINMETTYEHNTFKLDPAAYKWTLDNEDVAVITDGVIKGLKNGEAIIKTSDISNSPEIHLTVEIGKGVQEITAWPASPSNINNSGFNDITLSTTELPDGWAEGVAVNGTFASSRAPYLEIKQDVKFFGLPDSISWEQFLPAGLVKKMVVYLQSNRMSSFKEIDMTFAEGKTERIVIPFRELTSAWDILEFPITLTRIKFQCNTSAAKQAYSIGLKKLTAYYPEQQSGFAENKVSAAAVIYIGKDISLHYTLAAQSNVTITVFGIDGKMLQQQHFENQMAGSNQASLANFVAGTYILTLKTNDKQEQLKFIVH